jgi:hypothetical protein
MISINLGENMGGWGSRRRSGKETTSDYRRWDIRGLQREGWLAPGTTFTTKWSRQGVEESAIQARSESDRIVLSYKHQYRGGPWESLEYPVFLERTICNYGGTRTWFLCPGQGCGRRVAILYSGRLFVCRYCRKLAYESQREQPHYRALSRVLNAQARMGWKGLCADDGLPPRRKGMHWKTYERQARRFRRLECEMNLEARLSFGAVF